MLVYDRLIAYNTALKQTNVFGCGRACLDKYHRGVVFNNLETTVINLDPEFGVCKVIDAPDTTATSLHDK